MHNKPDHDGMLSAGVKGFGLGVLAFLMLSMGMLTPAHASGGSINWGMGVYWNYAGYGSSVSDLGVDFYNNGLPADSNGDETFASFTATIYAGTTQFIAQVAIENVDYTGNVGPFLFEDLLMGSNLQLDTNFGTGGIEYQSLSGLLGAWHTTELKMNTSLIGGTNYEYLNWMMDGNKHVSFQLSSCSCSPAGFNTYMVPSLIVASPDNSTSDFSSLDVHGYFEAPFGTIVGNAYFYPAYWGACPYGSQSQSCPVGGGSCPVASGAQTSSVYVERDNEAPSNVDVTGHVYDSSWGATHEWAIGIGDTSGYTQIKDTQLTGTFCSSGPPQVA